MPHQLSSNDPTFTSNQLPDPPPSQPSKKISPVPPKIPSYSPTNIDLHESSIHLPIHIDPRNPDPVQLFRLAFPDDILDAIAEHTNQYARLPSKDGKGKGREQSRDNFFKRPWHDTCRAELYGYIAIQIYMGIHPETAIHDYWNQDPDLPRHQLVIDCMSLVRFQQVERYFHLSPQENTQENTQESDTRSQKPSRPGSKIRRENETTFVKVHLLSEHLLFLFPTLFRPSTHLAVDEAIARFTGRSHHIINIPGKPTPEGYKMWVLACDGFVLAWLFHTKRKYYGPIDLETKWLRDPYKLSKTEAVVATLLHRFQENGNFQYIVWLDNLFTSARLLVILRDTLGYDAAGTVRSALQKVMIMREVLTTQYMT